MRYAVAIIALAASIAHAAPAFFTPGMMKRNGLTDEQYQLLWSMGRNPQIETGAAREWVFKASRFYNVMDWLDDLGKTNDFARLAARVPHLVETNTLLVATNRVLKTELVSWNEKADAYWDGWTNSYANATNYMSKYAVASSNLVTAIENYNIASNRAEIAESIAAAKIGLIQEEIDRLNEEKADLEEKIASATYVVLRPWLRLKLAAVEAAIEKLQGNGN